MPELIPVLVPLINTNEADAVLVSLAVKEGQWVKTGALLAEFETTKAAADLCAEHAGYVLGLSHQEGDTLRAGEIFCYLSEKADAALPVEEAAAAKEEAPEGLRITQPALTLAQEFGISLVQLPRDTLITEKLIRELFLPAAKPINPKALVIYGGGGHAKALIELIDAAGLYQVEGVLDDHLPVGSKLFTVPVLGSGDLLLRLKAQGIGMVVNAVGGIGDITPRLRIYEHIAAAGLKVPSVIHPRAYIEKSARVADGAQVFFNAYIGSDTRTGFGCIINTGAILSHDCVLGDYVNVSPGAILAGAVTVGERTLIGMGVTINLGVKIGSGVRIGNSAVIKADVPDNSIVRAGAIWPERSINS
jgi:sugar O-acyltransferase (sialic acid O-acetyltransferase NeuD family)